MQCTCSWLQGTAPRRRYAPRVSVSLSDSQSYVKSLSSSVCQGRTQTPRRSRLLASAQGVTEQADRRDEKDDLQDEMEAFLREQAERESGGALAQSKAQEEGQEVGTDAVSDENVKQYCQDVSRQIKLLQRNRDMSLNEIKLTLAIEDPNVREQRQFMNVEHSSGVSRDEVAAALIEVAEGRVPKDRVALRELRAEMLEWPFLNAEEELQPEGVDSNYASITNTGAERSGPLRPKQMRRDPNEKPQSIVDMLPDWVGYGVLYGISSFPVILGVTVIVILFLNALK